jgi:uncharacterized protein YwgA
VLLEPQLKESRQNGLEDRLRLQKAAFLLKHLGCGSLYLNFNLYVRGIMEYYPKKNRGKMGKWLGEVNRKGGGEID